MINNMHSRMEVSLSEIHQSLDSMGQQIKQLKDISLNLQETTQSNNALLRVLCTSGVQPRVGVPPILSSTSSGPVNIIDTRPRISRVNPPSDDERLSP